MRVGVNIVHRGVQIRKHLFRKVNVWLQPGIVVENQRYSLEEACTTTLAHAGVVNSGVVRVNLEQSEMPLDRASDRLVQSDLASTNHAAELEQQKAERVAQAIPVVASSDTGASPSEVAPVTASEGPSAPRKASAPEAPEAPAVAAGSGSAMVDETTEALSEMRVEHQPAKTQAVEDAALQDVLKTDVRDLEALAEKIRPIILRPSTKQFDARQYGALLDELPDDYFDMKPEDAKCVLAEARRRAEDRALLKTREVRDHDAQKRVAHFQKTTVLVVFPDQWRLQMIVPAHSSPYLVVLVLEKVLRKDVSVGGKARALDIASQLRIYRTPPIRDVYKGATPAERRRNATKSFARDGMVPGVKVHAKFYDDDVNQAITAQSKAIKQPMFVSDVAMATLDIRDT